MLQQQWVVRFKDSPTPIILGVTHIDPSRDKLTQVAEDINRDYPFLCSARYDVRLEQWSQECAAGVHCSSCHTRLAPPKVSKNLLWPVRCFNCDTLVTLPENERK